ncbi:MAG: alpha-glucan family phosphorylase [Gammaproteobacteria bacterium]|nr:alpha-glucan family phosphorylase [Gammaproteobacteria bacterium]
MSSTIFDLEVRPVIPEQLSGLNELANNLLYSWDRNVRGLFYRLDLELWDRCDHKPKVFLRRISQQTLDEAVKDNVFMEEYNRVMSAYNSYLKKITHDEIDGYLDADHDLIAYFCAEFGLHESFPIYSGGLGILAGDHCKAVSDLGVPFVAIGLLYRQGYFTQRIDNSGNQIAYYPVTRFSELPIEKALDAKGKQIFVTLDFPGRQVKLKVWQTMAGHTRMYLLDSNLEENTEADREITFQLYGGDSVMRLQQEIVLGIGGVRLLRKLDLEPTVFHINEGHAAFLILERCRELIMEQGLDFDSALELVAASNVFTTHTPVPAGHDMFDEALMKEFSEICAGKLKISFERFMELGISPNAPHSFNMTALALRGSRFHNGVSRIHGGVASKMEAYIWPQVPPEENPITYVTNGVHVPTFLAREWVNLFDMRFREWRNQLLHKNYWKCIDDIPDHRFWSLRQELKTLTLENLHQCTLRRYRKNKANDALIKKITAIISKPDADVLILGFARRFATYKRATLMFKDPARLSRLLNNPDKPVVLVFAGKAHPKDQPGQELIRTVHNYAHKPEFQGKIILLEDYNMAMARNLVTGVDVWINNPEYPMEASGTSGEKAAINGVLNLSVLDGWWGEGYNGRNGWAISPHGTEVDPEIRDQEEAHDLLDILENEVIPIFYNRGKQGYSKYWVKLSKASMKTCIPKFNASRMVMDYVRKLYSPARDQYIRLNDKKARGAKALAKWKNNIHQSWHNISFERIDDGITHIHPNESLKIKISAFLNGLSPDDVAVECVIGHFHDDGEIMTEAEGHRFSFEHEDNGRFIFSLDLQPSHPGLNQYKVRMYPYHELLSHPLETGYLIWL